ncbi:rhomboid family intramembrane serine protease GlpG [Yersinia intermedia]|nr:rhomboid family intramembrane serine protease GlpG [Yersinia intermedia]AJJ17543.1 rhomboid family protease GlpG [Yersinia intermedia]MCB5299145.1 rhomboid family intramembrane serine protease GlpG [Yersinia intermedia]MCB5312544.1 rhomboid family intramembrane serine protease GlpG [Yersinia intermedia]MCB5323069.1 rhomboid family intramembrane serine protease GlpG [Yersinia intermedia]MCB5326481.1 rhomboid family intramembrane serine protease GlpG [Yersinia intermedia]
MIRVIAISNPRLAQAFVDYMATRNVVLEVRPDTQGAEIWLADDEQLPLVQQELEQFLLEPLNPRYQAASWQSGNLHSNLSYQRFSYLQTLRSQAGPLTLSVMVLCIAIYILMQIVGDAAVMSWLAWPRDESQYLQLWRWVSHGFLHFSLLHILFNLMWWWYLAGQMEKRLGTGKLLVLTVVSALFSGWGQSLFSGVNFGGLSGVVYALMGYVWLTGERAPERGISLPRGLMAFSVLWLIAGYFDVLGLSIANAAHVSGLIIGLLMAFWDTRSSVRTTQ